MLPPGHFAAGYLLAEGVIAVFHPTLSTSQTNWFLFSGGFFGFAPDIDMFYGFWKEKGLRHTGKNFTHRAFVTHTPLFWFILGGSLLLFAPTTFIRLLGLLLWLAPWSHLLLDSMNTGVRWLYPFNKKFYAFKNPGIEIPNKARGFFNHWWNLLKHYYQLAPLTFWTEVMLVAIALYIFFR